jgi:hypothetical protein
MGKAKDGSNCYTRQNKSGGSYVTCEGKQKSGKSAAQGARQAQPAKAQPKVDWNRSDTARGRARRAAAARKLKTRQSGRIETGPLNPGSVITDFDTSAFVREAPGVVGMTSTMTSSSSDAKINENVRVYKSLRKKYTKMKIDELRKLVPPQSLGDTGVRRGFKTKSDFVNYLSRRGLPHSLDYDDSVKMMKLIMK